MKKTLIFILALTLGGSVIAQTNDKLSKVEKKYWKKEARNFKKHPELLKELMEEQDEEQAKMFALELQFDSLETLVAAYEKDMVDLNKHVTSLQRELKSQKELVMTLNKEKELSKHQFDKGTTYRVQIGAFKKRDMSEFFANSGSFQGEMANETQKYTVGIFHNKAKANTFKLHLQALGLTDAWIVKYVDGKRVTDQGAVVATSE